LLVWRGEEGIGGRRSESRIGRRGGGGEKKKTVLVAKMLARKQSNLTQFFFALCNTQLVNYVIVEARKPFISGPELTLSSS
jgi:hypothetical protein